MAVVTSNSWAEASPAPETLFLIISRLWSKKVLAYSRPFIDLSGPVFSSPSVSAS